MHNTDEDTGYATKIGVNMPGLSMDGELISRPVPATKMGQAPDTQHRTIPSIGNILADYLESSSGVADLSRVDDVTLVSSAGFSCGE